MQFIDPILNIGNLVFGQKHTQISHIVSLIAKPNLPKTSHLFDFGIFDAKYKINLKI